MGILAAIIGVGISFIALEGSVGGRVSPAAESPALILPPPDASSSRSQPPVPAEDTNARAAAQASAQAAAQAAAEQTRLAQEAANASKKATKDAPFENSLGMRFVPLPGRDALMSVWDTRVKDFRAYAQASGYRQQGGIYVFKVIKTKDGKGHTTTFELEAGASWEKPGFPQTAAHPVVGVSWEEAKAFCGWLTAKERGEGKIGKGQEYRLPTDEEWSEAVGGARYPWGNQWPPSTMAGNYCDTALVSTFPGKGWSQVPGNDGYAHTSPVGTYRPNRLGLYDMGGNVWQWCEDWYRASMNEREVLEKFPLLKDDGGGKICRVVRGGSWYNNVPESLLSSYRNRGNPDIRDSFYGFRCILGGSPPSEPAANSAAASPAAQKQDLSDFEPVQGTRPLAPQQPTASTPAANRAQPANQEPAAAKIKPQPHYIAFNVAKAGTHSPGPSVMVYDTWTSQIVGNNVYHLKSEPIVGSTAKYDTYTAQHVGDWSNWIKPSPTTRGR